MRCRPDSASTRVWISAVLTAVTSSAIVTEATTTPSGSRSGLAVIRSQRVSPVRWSIVCASRGSGATPVASRRTEGIASSGTRRPRSSRIV